MRTLVAAVALLASTGLAQAAFVIAPDQGLAFSIAAVRKYEGQRWRADLAQRRKDGVLGCRAYCARLQRIFARLEAAARAHATDNPPHWDLAVSRSPTDMAFSLAGGHVLIGEPFIRKFALTDDQIAFVLAHEMAHVLYQHDRQYLTEALHLLPRGVKLSVYGIYGSLSSDINMSFELFPVRQRQEYAADRAGLFLATYAGFKPRAMLGFMRKLAVREDATKGYQWDPEHPRADARLKRLEALLPMAQALRRGR